jgi:hypothetical protein
MTWMQRLKRVFNIDISTCEQCGGAVKIIACIEDPAVIDKILTHLRQQAEKGLHAHSVSLRLLPKERAPPQFGLFG